MVLAISIGNTNIHAAVFRKNDLLGRYCFSTYAHDLAGHVKRIYSRHPFDDAIICSVVPKITRAMEKGAEKIIQKKAWVVNRTIEVPLVNLYRNPRQLGQDRLINAYAVSKLYKTPAIVVDVGTAITFDIVSKRGRYLGGLILPGLGMCAQALSGNTALLPKIKIRKPREFVAKDTLQGMRSGLVHGFAVMIDGLIEKIKEEIKSDACVIATGGDSRILADYCTQLNVIDLDLTLKGLNTLYHSLHR